MTVFVFTVEGKPVPWKRTTTYQGRRLTPAAQRDYQDKVRLVALASCAPALRAASAKDMGLTWAVGLSIVVPDRRIRDTDNIQKTIGDALNGVLWADDSLISEWHVRRTLDRERPRVDVVAVPRSAPSAAWSRADLLALLGVGPRRAAA